MQWLQKVSGSTVLCAVALLGTSCGGKSEAYLSDTNVCQKNEDDLATTTPSVSDDDAVRMVGTYGSDPRLAQNISASAEKQLWGVQLLMEREGETPNEVEINVRGVDGDGYPDDDDSNTVTKDAADIPLEPGWVTFRFLDVETLEKNDLYYITVTPGYLSAEIQRIRWYAKSGDGLASYSVESSSWSFETGREAYHRLIRCQ